MSSLGGITFQDLPEELVYQICVYIPAPSLLATSLSCKLLARTLEDDTLWRIRCKRDFKWIKEPYLGTSPTWKDCYRKRVTGSRRKRKRPTPELTLEGLEQRLEEVDEETFIIIKAKNETIKECVQRELTARFYGEKYKTGCAYYQHTKSESVSYRKRIVLQDRDNGQFYTGESARSILVKLEGPAWNKGGSRLERHVVFIQSNSTTRKLVGGTSVLYDLSSALRSTKR